jgi:hypothetical protein
MLSSELASEPNSSGSTSVPGVCLVTPLEKGAATFLVIALRRVKAEGEGGIEIFF